MTSASKTALGPAPNYDVSAKEMDEGLKHQAMREWTRMPTPHQASRARTNSLAEVIPGLMARMGLEQLVQQRQIIDAWPQLVGPAIARYAQPTQFQRGILTVSVNNSVWLQELSRYHKTTILQKFGRHFNPSPVKDIVFRIG